jgi:F420-dependent methylenetetrahydromethanopterin dehydrogenase
MRVLIVYEDSHRSYGEAMVGAIRASRPGLEAVSLAHLRELEAEVERFDPHLVVSSQPNTFDPGARAAWVLLSDDPYEPSEVCIDGRHRRLENPGLEQILEMIDETEALLGSGRELRGC